MKKVGYQRFAGLFLRDDFLSGPPIFFLVEERGKCYYTDMNPFITHYRQHTAGVISLAWSPDGRWLASGDRHAVVQVWHPQRGMLHALFEKHALEATQVIWAPDSQTLVSAGIDEDRVFHWQANTGEVLQTYPITGGSNACLAWSPNGTFLAASGNGSPFIWRVHDQRLIVQLPIIRLGPTTLAWSPDGGQFALGGGKNIYVYDTGSWSLLWRTTAHTLITKLAYAPNGTFLASSGYDATIQIRESKTGRFLLLYRGHAPGVHKEGQDALRQLPHSSRSVVVWSLAWSPDSQSIASCSGTILNVPRQTDQPLFNLVQVWEALTGQHISTYSGHRDQVRSVAWSPDGRYLASASLDQTVQVWPAPGVSFPNN
jgi:WD40 repeat protein